MDARTLVLLVPLVACSLRDAPPQPAPVAACTASPSAFTFAALGDLPYSEPAVTWRALIEDVGSAHPAFAVHVGDIKPGGTACTDAYLEGILADFRAWPVPLVYTPGDNEWTDCGRSGSEPLERLAWIRARFFASEQSLGRPPLPLALQAAPYRENARWVKNGVVFATLHLVGSNNGIGRDAAGDAEARARTTADLAWMQEAFAAAREAPALVLLMQADMDLESPAADRRAFTGLSTALERSAAEYGKPVLLVHGDTHVYRLDRPLAGAPRLTRLIVFGDRDVHWVEVVVDPAQPQVFGVRPRLVAGNPRRQRPGPSSLDQACFP